MRRSGLALGISKLLSPVKSQSQSGSQLDAIQHALLLRVGLCTQRASRLQQNYHAASLNDPEQNIRQHNNNRDALRIISLREDFKTAKVEGKTLGQLFTGAVEGVMSIRV